MVILNLELQSRHDKNEQGNDKKENQVKLERAFFFTQYFQYCP